MDDLQVLAGFYYQIADIYLGFLTQDAVKSVALQTILYNDVHDYI